ncbi:cystatin-B-like [Triplophysa dalaica]|uniref:cystatin-B-like n=1 Tax=Triplophysa dalaica TaxID=1582913 RepID=UPI0024DFD5B3|nr:cystatin-B-like [Triplophysa dalaica]
MDETCGGWSREQDVQGHPEIQKICDMVKPHVEIKVGKIFEEFTAKRFISQVVAGMNYIIKVHVGGSVFVLVKVFQALPYEGGVLTLGVCQYPKEEGDPLTPS